MKIYPSDSIPEIMCRLVSVDDNWYSFCLDLALLEIGIEANYGGMQ